MAAFKVKVRREQDITSQNATGYSILTMGRYRLPIKLDGVLFRMYVNICFVFITNKFIGSVFNYTLNIYERKIPNYINIIYYEWLFQSESVFLQQSSLCFSNVHNLSGLSERK